MQISSKKHTCRQNYSYDKWNNVLKGLASKVWYLLKKCSCETKATIVYEETYS